ncbi:uncharacterized protein LOC119615619 [Lucilia sericata]|uniref:uncharacterized protein LOC119615619 n=1 Tax=Lucilia sericata TaxID=13632 RepID=UPI0018A8332D|nr:uncharacterized protein LOC119615619 [Lucilia sericata]
MFKTKLLYLLVLSFALKNILAQPDSAHVDEEPSPQTPKQHLFMFSVEGFKNLTSFYVNKAANISDKVLKDATFNDAANGHIVLQKFKQNLTDFLNRYQKHQEFEELFELVELYSNTTSDYYEMTREQLNPDMEMIVNVLRKYGSEKLDQDFKVMYEQFVEDFKVEFRKVEMYLDKNMLDWFEQFKTIQEMNARTEAFEKFIMFYL